MTAALSPAPELLRLFNAVPGLRLTWDDRDIYRQLRSQEPHLVSCVDDASQHFGNTMELLGLQCAARPVASLSIILQTNRYRPPGHALYARIDLVMVDPRERGLGRLLLLSALTHLFHTHGTQLYSISCLAAHPAVAHILEGAGFTPRATNENDFQHEEIRLDSLSGSELAALLTQSTGKTAEALRLIQFRLRQQQDAVPA